MICTEHRFLAEKLMNVVLGKSYSQAKHTAMHVLPGQKMPTASFAQAKDATASFA